MDNLSFFSRNIFLRKSIRSSSASCNDVKEINFRNTGSDSPSEDDSFSESRPFERDPESIQRLASSKSFGTGGSSDWFGEETAEFFEDSGTRSGVARDFGRLLSAAAAEAAASTASTSSAASGRRVFGTFGSRIAAGRNGITPYDAMGNLENLIRWVQIF